MKQQQDDSNDSGVRRVHESKMRRARGEYEREQECQGRARRNQENVTYATDADLG